MWVKICGITRLEDALAAEEMGADAIGFIFATSPRQIRPEIAAQICEHIKRAKKVGVFVNSDVEELKRIKSLCGLDIIQLHGEESADLCRSLGGLLIKAFRARNRSIVSDILEFQDAWKLLLDAYVPGQRGGTGRQIDEEILRLIEDYSRVILAGGINAENVASILYYRPFGIDVSSGVESEPGTKDLKKMKQLFNAIGR